MKADVSNYDANIAKARRALDGFKQDNLTMGGILNQSTKSIIGLAAQYASFAAVLGTVASGFAEAVSKGKEMSREAEGVKMAFDRLNQPGLLDSLREATHGTVNDLELMKQAVKFDNFNLSLEQMGTFLAFAQQQAKDTGQDVNYLVDSIVTGLGRKSLPILDNLGLSAEDIKNRMKETGDMTTAVAQIIEDRMSAAGDYVETAADRAAQAQARLDNAMKELGDTMNSLSGAGASLWSELEIGAINLANTAIKPLISLFNELASYIQGPTVEGIITGGMEDVTDTVDDNGRLIRKSAINSIPEITVSGTAPKKKKKTTTGGTKTEPTYAADSIAAMEAEVSMLTKAWKEAGAAVRDDYAAQLKEAQLRLDNVMGNDSSIAFNPEQAARQLEVVQGKNVAQIPLSSDASFETWLTGVQDQLANLKFEPIEIPIETTAGDVKAIAQAASITADVVGSIGDAFNAIEDPAAKVMGTVAQAIASVAMGYAQATVAAAQTGNPWVWAAFAVSGLATMITMISNIHSATGYAEGGIVGGTSYSGDNIPIMANAGELVLTKAQQGNLAQQLEGAGMQNLQLEGVVKGENLHLIHNRYLKRTGQGELLTW